MKKIPTVLRRDPNDRAHVLPEVTPGCEWVLAGEGVATRKYDGTCVLHEFTWWFARREVKIGKAYPNGFWAIDFDKVTGKTVGWEPIEQSPFAKFHQEAVAGGTWAPGTYELIGPKINGNPEHQQRHRLIEHAAAETVELPVPLDVKTVIQAVAELEWEGIVWHHPDGRMAKLKRRDLLYR